MTQVYSIKQKGGYTLVELVIIVAITSLLVTIGVSAYGKARDRQIGQSSAEVIMNILKESQQTAMIGKIDTTKCLGAFLGRQVNVLATSNTITTQGLCASGNEDVISFTIPNITFSNGATQSVTFKPLSGNADFSGGTELLINFSSTSTIKYRIQITNAGGIVYQGVQP